MNHDSSFGLLKQANAGDRLALDRLLLRYLSRMRRWATRRLPAWARERNDTEDLVQDTLLNAFRNLRAIRMEHDGSLRVYMRRALRNRINDEIRRAVRNPTATELQETLPADVASPLEQSITRQDLARCRAAIARLRPADREIILVKLAHGAVSFRTLAALTGRSSEDAARVAFTRALHRLAHEMTQLESSPS
jgi:RNA polymerase sigma-70 factor (ECF subfamily)